MSKTRIVIATPSLIDQSRLEKSLGQTNAFDVVSATSDLSATYSKVEELMPDLVIVSETFMRQDEYQCMVSLFRAVEARVVTLGSSVGGECKSSYHHPHAPVIHARMDPILLSRLLTDAPSLLSSAPSQHGTVSRDFGASGGFSQDKVILIGASTGGIDALTTILHHFPKDCPPTAIVQHTGQNFSETLARLLDRRCDAEVVVAQTGVEMQPGRICLAGGIDGHMRLEQRASLRCNVVRGAATSGHIPSIDELFTSALPIAPSVVAALLTGMGRDGATGLLRLRQAGATTIGQDEATSVVYGMPRVAFETGAVQQQLPLVDIGPAIMRACARQQLQRAKAAL